MIGEKAEECERSVLGALMLDPDPLFDLDLAADDFLVPWHRTVWRMLQVMASNAEPIDVVTVSVRLTNNPSVPMAELVSLPEVPPSAVSVHHYAGMVRQASFERRLRDLLEKHLVRLLEARDAVDVRDSLVQALAGLDYAAGQKRLWTMPEVHRMLIERAEAPDEENVDRVLPTGIYKLDSTLYRGGLLPGQMLIVGGRPGCGKTGFANGLAVHWARNGKTVLYWSGEEDEEELYQRGRRNLQRTVDDHAAAYDDMAGLVYFSEPGASMDHIEREARRLAVRGLDAIVIDYVQRLEHRREKGENEATAVGRTSTRCKKLAMALRVPIVVASQLNRDIEERLVASKPKGKAADPDPNAVPGPDWFEDVPMPHLSDLRASGQLEQDADIVVFPLQTTSFGLKASPYAGIRVAKQRKGPNGYTVPVRWDGRRTRYEG